MKEKVNPPDPFAKKETSNVIYLGPGPSKEKVNKTIEEKKSVEKSPEK